MIKYGLAVFNSKNRAFEIFFNQKDVEGYLSFNLLKDCPEALKKSFAIEKRKSNVSDAILYSSEYSDVTFAVTPCKFFDLKRRA